MAIAGCGLCGSNIPVWEGRPWFTYPLDPGVPGHEAWGTVEEIGHEVTGFSVGSPVALLTTDALATTTLAAADQVVRLPAELAGVAFPGEALACGFNIAARSRFHSSDTVAVIGIGFIGAAVTALAVHAGARVIAIARRTESLDLAHALGAAETILMDDHQRIIETVGQLTDGRFCNTVVEAAGEQWPLDLGGELTGFGGRLVIAGYHQDGARSVNMQLWNWRGIDVINAHERDQAKVRHGVLEAAGAVTAGWFDPSVLYSHTFDFDHVDKAMNALIQKPGGFVKALVTM
ncbi:MAG: Threonine dehydrogenase-related Zn-dependent dehydrogenase [Ilumatobacteraceae bacterium]|nr:Threonine dehydrogenase-related Zn-dependent dehydrogenase [Ilumatobacteraceae bacterium]